MVIKYRQAEKNDHAITYDIATKAMQDLLDRHNFPYPRHAVIQPTDLALREYAYEFHRDSYWIAEDAGSAIGFALAVCTEARWYLISLHVLPKYQGAGIGQRLLEHTLSVSDKSSQVLCVETESIQPVSIAMYIRAGMFPWIPMYEWDGKIPDSFANTPEKFSFTTPNSTEDMNKIDQKVLGFQRTSEHQFWMNKRGLAIKVISYNGSVLGYVYFSKDGKIGPAASTIESVMEPLILHAVEKSRELGASQVHLKIPGQSPAIQSVATSMGLRVRAPAATMLASRPIWRLGQYLVSGSDSLLV
jgi:GNAT superfamily N-acetyltransferase